MTTSTLQVIKCQIKSDYGWLLIIWFHASLSGAHGAGQVNAKDCKLDPEQYEKKRFLHQKTFKLLFKENFPFKVNFYLLIQLFCFFAFFYYGNLFSILISYKKTGRYYEHHKDTTSGQTNTMNRQTNGQVTSTSLPTSTASEQTSTTSQSTSTTSGQTSTATG